MMLPGRCCTWKSQFVGQTQIFIHFPAHMQQAWLVCLITWYLLWLHFGEKDELCLISTWTVSSVCVCVCACVHTLIWVPAVHIWPWWVKFIVLAHREVGWHSWRRQVPCPPLLLTLHDKLVDIRLPCGVDHFHLWCTVECFVAAYHLTWSLVRSL